MWDVKTANVEEDAATHAAGSGVRRMLLIPQNEAHLRQVAKLVAGSFQYRMHMPDVKR